MPATSKAQFRKMEELHKQGKITDAQLSKFTGGVDFEKLPDRAGKAHAKASGHRGPARHQTHSPGKPAAWQMRRQGR